MLLCAELRRAGLRVDRGFDGRSMKSQMKSADRSGARWCAVDWPQRTRRGNRRAAPATPRRRTVRGGPGRSDRGRCVPRSALVRPPPTITKDLDHAHARPPRRPSLDGPSPDRDANPPVRGAAPRGCRDARALVWMGGSPTRARRAPGVRRPTRPQRAHPVCDRQQRRCAQRMGRGDQWHGAPAPRRDAQRSPRHRRDRGRGLHGRDLERGRTAAVLRGRS